MMPDHELLQSDCVRAYVQAKLTGLKTFVRLPRAWWPASWYDDKGQPRFVDSVVKLLKALYGHPLAGDI